MRRAPALATLLLLAACSGGAPANEDTTTTTQADSLTRRQRDSAIATMPIPGAGAVGKALEAADAAAARAQAHDTIH